ncbi:hypothetical protein H5410_030259 [Solanum commersonii]|uniref:Uncharacterized protein n=1 Tax=Solanum commersonii TaxID=4109 RepID=A0A9J5YF53_SOLCO|nr:hypothetical protein H5410_030259 [Solanum commersonii]
MALGRRFIADKYGMLSQWATKEVMITFRCSVWKTIRRLWTQVYINISFQVDSGVEVDFWSEHWVGKENLRSLFPKLYILSSQRNASCHGKMFPDLLKVFYVQSRSRARKVLEEEEPMKTGGGPSQLLSGGHCGRRKIPDVLKGKGPTARRIKSNALVYFIIGVNRKWWGT